MSSSGGRLQEVVAAYEGLDRILGQNFASLSSSRLIEYSVCTMAYMGRFPVRGGDFLR